MKRLLAHTAIIAFLSALSGSASAQLLYGPDARADFHDWQMNYGGTLVDFQSVGAGTLLDNQLSGMGVRFHTISDVSGNPITPGSVYVDNVGGDHRIMGRRLPALNDGRAAYEIAFDTPQRWAGVDREWNTSSITRFFDLSGNLLAPEHQNTVNSEFVGFLATDEDAANWISRIEIDGGATRQVGFTDDLVFGVAVVPEPSIWALLGIAGAAALLAARRKR